MRELTTSHPSPSLRIVIVPSRFGPGKGTHRSASRAKVCGWGWPYSFPPKAIGRLSGSDRVPQPIMPLDLPVKVRSWELTVYPRSHIRRLARGDPASESSNVNVLRKEG